MHRLFGSVPALDNDARTLLCSIASVAVFALTALFRPLALEHADLQSVRSESGFSVVTEFTFLALVVLNLVASFHALGTLMAVGIEILPAAVARFRAIGIGAPIAIAVSLAMLSSLGGLPLSCHFSQQSGPAIIPVAGLAYALSPVFGPVGKPSPTTISKPERSFNVHSQSVSDIRHLRSLPVAHRSGHRTVRQTDSGGGHLFDPRRHGAAHRRRACRCHDARRS